MDEFDKCQADLIETYRQWRIENNVGRFEAQDIIRQAERSNLLKAYSSLGRLVHGVSDPFDLVARTFARWCEERR